MAIPESTSPPGEEMITSTGAFGSSIAKSANAFTKFTATSWQISQSTYNTLAECSSELMDTTWYPALDFLIFV